MRSLGTCEVIFDDVFVPDEHVLGEAGQGWRLLTGDAQQRADHGRPRSAAARSRAMLEDMVAYAKTASVRQADRPVPGHPAHDRQHADGPGAAAAAHLPRGLAAARRAAHAASSPRWPRSSRPSAASRPPTSASRSSAATATRPEYDMQRYWRDLRLYRSARHQRDGPQLRRREPRVAALLLVSPALLSARRRAQRCPRCSSSVPGSSLRPPGRRRRTQLRRTRSRI